MPDLTPNQIQNFTTLLTDISTNLSWALAEQINREVDLALAEIKIVTLSEILGRSEDMLQSVFSLTQPAATESLFFVSDECARVFIELIEGRDGLEPPGSLTDPQVETLCNAMSGLSRGFATALANRTGLPVELEHSVPHLGPINVPPVFALEGIAFQARFTLTIPGVLDTELIGLFTVELTAELCPEEPDNIGAGNSGGSDGMLSEDDVAAMLSQMGGGDYSEPTPSAPVPPPAASAGPFANLMATGPESTLPRGIELILDIPLDVTVELGRVRMLIKDVLELSSGSIIELDRVAGEPVDLLVNGRLVAKGEVVVIEDNFGLRITEIISPADRVAGLGKGR